MGFLDFVKSIFKEETKEEIKQETISINNLPDWIENKSKSISDGLNNSINLIKNKIEEEIKSTKDNLKKLASAELRNPHISLKEKQFMQGNREAYIRRVNVFVDRITLPDSHKGILALCTNFDKDLQSFGKSTARPYHILQEFFGHESRDVAINIKNLDKHIKDLKETIKSAGLDKTEKIKADIGHLMTATRQKDDYIAEIKQAKEAIDSLKNLKHKTEEEISTFKNSDESSAHEKLKKDKAQATKDLEEHNKQLFHSFAVLERPLKKFHHIAFENEKFIESYIQNPATALQNDKELKIIDILRKLKENVEGNKLDLKDKKKGKTLDEIKKLNQEFFVYFSNKHNKLKNKLDEINEQLGKSTVEDKLAELNKKLEKLNTDIDAENKRIDSSKIQLEKIDIDKLKSNLEKEIKNLNISIKISMP